ncbi:MAG: hypothetical protein K6347_00635 [Campylobacterales bacterium]
MRLLMEALQSGRGILWIPSSLEEAQSQLSSLLATSRHRFFPGEEKVRDFLIDDAHAMIAEAAIASPEPKYLIAIATNYRQEAQNALLKLLEEPPSNVRLILVGLRQSFFLPTIRSRLLCIRPQKREQHKVISRIDPLRLDLKTIDEEIGLSASMSKEELKEWIAALFARCAQIPSRLCSDRDLLDLFAEAMRLSDLNVSAQLVVSVLLLKLYRQQR